MDQKVSSSLTLFAAKFCNELGTSMTSVCSPLSAETVLALLALGCRGQTRAELLQALDMADDNAIRSSFGNLTSSLKSIEGSEFDEGPFFIKGEQTTTCLRTANRIYLKKGVTLKPALKKDAEEVFGSDLEQLDFNEREASAGVINDWVAQQTNDLIKHIVSADIFTQETSMLMINAIYFKAQWEVPFTTGGTANRDFCVNKETIIKVPQMFMKKQAYPYGCSKKLQAKLLKMHYEGRKASMVIVLPDEIDGLDRIMELLAKGYDLQSDIKKMKNTTLDVMIPKFKAEMTIDLKELLPKLGIKSIFDKGNTDIDMLTSNQSLFVSDAIQKVFINVDEFGTEAAAVNAIHYMLCSAMPYPKFIANRPFLYLLTCQEIPLFIGVYKGTEYAE